MNELIPDFNNLSDSQIREIESKAVEGFLDNGHALISPSGIYSWGRCVGNVRRIHEHRAIGQDNAASTEGTSGHFFLEMCLATGVHPLNFDKSVCVPDHILADIRKWAYNVSSKKHNKPEVQTLAIDLANNLVNRQPSAEMRLEIAKVVDVIHHYQKLGYTLIPEAKVSMRKWLGHDQCDGTSDVVLYSVERNHLIIADLKYGIGIEVFPEENKQLLLYCLGVLAMLIDNNIIDVTSCQIDIVICQPRINNRFWDVWTTDYAYLYEFAKKVKVLSARALFYIGNQHLIQESDFDPSKAACTFCAHRTNCNPRANMALADLESVLGDAGIVVNESTSLIPAPAVNQPMGELITNIPTQRLVAVMKAAPFILGVIKDIQEEIDVRVRAGNAVEGVKLVHGKSARKWRCKPAVLEAALRDAGVLDSALITKLPSPPQLEKMLDVPQEVRTEIMNTYMEKIDGRPVLALAGDRRKSIDEVRAIRDAEALAAAGIEINE